MARPSELLAVWFENDQHKQFHNILLDNEFNFQVNGRLEVGREYLHPTKPVKVLLEDGDRWMEAKVLYRGEVQTDKEYTAFEWNWMVDGIPGPEHERQILLRELHILLKIRPHFMKQFSIAEGG